MSDNHISDESENFNEFDGYSEQGPGSDVLEKLAALWDTPGDDDDDFADFDDDPETRSDDDVDITGKTETQIAAEAKAKSKVMVIKRRYIRTKYRKSWTPMDAGALRDVVDVSKLRFMTRVLAEKSDTYKQIIPYVVLLRRDPETKQVKVLSYQRSGKSGEIRLLGKRSIGFGGHIEPCDVEVFMEEAYEAGIARELREELGIMPGEILYLRTVGVINNEDDAVGKVHMGMILTATTHEELDLSEVEDSMVDVKYVAIPDLVADIEQYETWSRIVIRHLLATMHIDEPIPSKKE